MKNIQKILLIPLICIPFIVTKSYGVSCGTENCASGTFCRVTALSSHCVPCTDNDSNYPLSDPDDNATSEKCYKDCEQTMTISNGTATLTGDTRVYAPDGTCEYTVSCDTGYYPGTAPESPECKPYTLTINYDLNGGADGLDWCPNNPCDTRQTCYYNDESCMLSSIKYITKPGYQFGGWCNGTTCYDAGQDLAIDNILNTLIMDNLGNNSTVATITLTAQWEKINCDPGTYYNGVACTQCTSGNYCHGTPDDGGDAVQTPCPLSPVSKSAARSDDVTDCYIPSGTKWKDIRNTQLTFDVDIHFDATGNIPKNPTGL